MAARSEYLQIRVTPAEKARLKRLAAAAGQDLSGFVLSRALPAGERRFDELLSLLREETDHRYVLAELNDLLSASSAGELAALVARGEEAAKLTPFLQNYVAALIEHAAHGKGVRPPAWTAGIAPLETPWFATSLRSLRLHMLRVSPAAFKRRNLFVDSSVGARV